MGVKPSTSTTPKAKAKGSKYEKKEDKEKKPDKKSKKEQEEEGKSALETLKKWPRPTTVRPPSWM